MNASKLAGLSLCVGLAASALAVPATYQRYIGTPGIEEGGAIATTRDGGCVLACVRRSAAAGVRNIVVIKLDYTGATQWEREVFFPNDETPLSITQTSDGGYALVADVTGVGAGLGLGILKLNPVGGYMWGQVWFGNPSGTGVHGAKIIESGTANNLVIASRGSFGAGVGQLPVIIQLTAAGGLVWANGYADTRYASNQYGSFMDIRPFRDPTGGLASGFLACGWTQAASTAPREPLVMWVNAAGINVVQNTYSPVGLDRYFNGLDILPAGDVALTASDTSPDSYYYNLSPLLVAAPPILLNRFKPANESIYSTLPAGVIIGGNDTIAGGNGALLRVHPASGTFAHMSFGGALADRVDQTSPALDGAKVVGTINSFTHGSSDIWAFRSDLGLRTGCTEGPVAQPNAIQGPVSLPVPFTRIGQQFAPWNPQVVPVTDINTIICLKCPADFNGDGVVDFFDYLDYVDAFSLGLLSADFNGDGVIDFFDYLDFVDAFSLGC